MKDDLEFLKKVVDDLISKVNTGVGLGMGLVHEREELLVSKGKAPFRNLK